MDWVSRKQPRNSNSRFIASSMAKRLLKMLMTALEIMVGIFSVVINQAKG